LRNTKRGHEKSRRGTISAARGHEANTQSTLTSLRCPCRERTADQGKSASRGVIHFRGKSAFLPKKKTEETYIQKPGEKVSEVFNRRGKPRDSVGRNFGKARTARPKKTNTVAAVLRKNLYGERRRRPVCEENKKKGGPMPILAEGNSLSWEKGKSWDRGKILGHMSEWEGGAFSWEGSSKGALEKSRRPGKRATDRLSLILRKTTNGKTGGAGAGRKEGRVSAVSGRAPPSQVERETP